ncbi:MAG: PaeR7I family type II restriction endonuclease, partial [Pirellulales bacterium]|nr:PaeR7I family type II restriction endonuclease [Pirellulales bacterium]
MLSERRLKSGLTKAVKLFWETRSGQAKRQQDAGRSDQGARGAVTGGKQMDGFVRLVRDIITNAGLSEACIHTSTSLELPGYFRPEKKWDLVVVDDGVLIAAIDFKSQIGPSFGNNFNNRSEEAIGTAQDVWTAYREGAFPASERPWLGYVMMLEDCPRSTSPVAVREPH